MDVCICDYETRRLLKQEEIKQSQTENGLILKHNSPEREREREIKLNGKSSLMKLIYL